MKDSEKEIDSLLLKKLRRGDEQAFCQIFDQYHRYLYVLASRYLMSESYAEDAVQYTFMKLWEGRKFFDFRSGIKNLLFTILKNYVLNEIRHQNMVIQKNYELAQESEKVEANLFSKIADADFKKYLYHIIDQLPPQKRQVCLLKIEKGMTNQEVAEYMNISVPTVKSHYTQVIKFLRAKIADIPLLLMLMSSVYH